ncbi:IclR family transcriptional regulator [Azospirillum sp. YIM DDC1]|uniref:IclR family transcriptional regulator n=1 Tax=Azospirillum aestuarii TaxID=2802052 RepID=A0ABS1I200_9PROT|nr:IclR family transcriptional regulator [Azospirillum aestuarii]MBK3774342.1 helix-turn-helix domain-containing protein [Azospirillum brasilense]MBK4721120.1 IclR family transcriptional regulator [Azospirillum aestuarii]TWA88763.1 IclR family transcriptional regulator [Azospirillum brasilense]
MTRKIALGSAPLREPREPTTEDAADNSSGDRRPLADRVLALLDAVAGAGQPMAVKDIAEKLALPKPTAHRLIAMLEERGFLARPFDGRLVTVGPKLRTLALNTLRSSLAQAPSHARLRALSLELGETCNIGVLEGGDVVYLDRVEVEGWPLRLEFGVGSRVPLHCTAMGKLFLAFLPELPRRRLLDCLPLPRMSAATLCDPALFRAELERIAACGHSFDDEEYMPGVFCAAVPIRDGAGRMIAALAVQAPKVRLSRESVADRLPVLHRAASDMAHALGIDAAPAEPALSP